MAICKINYSSCNSNLKHFSVVVILSSRDIPKALEISDIYAQWFIRAFPTLSVKFTITIVNVNLFDYASRRNEDKTLYAHQMYWLRRIFAITLSKCVPASWFTYQSTQNRVAHRMVYFLSWSERVCWFYSCYKKA